MRTLEAIIPPHRVTGRHLQRVSMLPDRNHLSPFLRLEYTSGKQDPAIAPLERTDVPLYRGAESVTLVYDGTLTYNDCRDNSRKVSPGDVHWVTAGNGLLHHHHCDAGVCQTDGIFRFIQLQINLPAHSKTTRPRQQYLPHDKIPCWHLPEDKGSIDVIAGAYNDVTGSISTFSALHVLNARLQAGARVGFSYPAPFNTAFFVLNGTVTFNDRITINAGQLALLANDNPDFTITAQEAAVVLLLSGAPIAEPVEQQGPFVMNTPEEIYQSVRDYNWGKYGYLEE